MFYRIYKSVLILLAINFSLVGVCPAEQLTPMPSDWIQKIRPDHPRMFINNDTLSNIRDYALTVEKDYYAQIRHTVDTIPLEVDTESCERGLNNAYGRYAQSCAFVWLIESDPDALAKAKNYLKAGVKFYNACSSQRKAVQWYSAGRVCAITAFDWIFNQLSESEKREIGLGLIKHYNDSMSGPRFERQNRSDYQTGFYGPTNMPWYIGLALQGAGVDDAAADRLLSQGYRDHIRLLEYRKKAAGTKGGIGSIALGYGLGMYPFTEFNFMHTFQSATGYNVADSYDHISLLANWIFWNCLPGKQKFGLGDSSPAGGFGDSFIEMHMLNLAHFYAKKFPDRSELAMYVRDKLLLSQTHDDYWWPIAPFFVTACRDLPKPSGPDESWPRAVNFDSMGVIHMRSDHTKNATCAAYLSGGEINNHKHYDQGHFAIYSGEHLTGNSGHYGNRLRNDHLTEYFYRSVSANCVLIHANKSHDKPAVVWGGPAKTLDGGQSSHDAKQIDFETNDYYTYAATNITPCYDKRKCRLALRQFLFVYPDTFVVFDRVISTDPDFKKSWLLHSKDKPEITAPGCLTIKGENKNLLTTMLLPAQNEIELIGGEGNEFFSAGANHPQVGNMPELAGSWRAEFSPSQASRSDIFLSVLQVEDKNSSTTSAPQLIEENKQAGMVLDTGEQRIKILFNTTGPAGVSLQLFDADNKEILSHQHGR